MSLLIIYDNSHRKLIYVYKQYTIRTIFSYEITIITQTVDIHYI